MKKNRFIGILLFMFITSIAKAAEYELKAANVSAAQDGTATLAIELKNAGKIVGFQCDIYFPEGITPSGEMTMMRHTEGVHTLVKKVQDDGAIRVMIYSNPNTPFTGNSGVVLNVPLNVVTSPNKYTVSLKNSVLTGIGAVAHYVSNTVTTVTPYTPIEVTSLRLSKSSLSLVLGKDYQLKAYVSPSNATDKTVSWTSSDSTVATVDTEGCVYALSLGKATITASCGNKKAECKVTVAKKEQKITWNQSFANIKTGDVVELKATASSGLEVIYTVLEGDAVLKDNCLTVNKSGKVKIEASQPGNEEYEVAKSVVKIIDVVTGIDVIDEDLSRTMFFDINGAPVLNPKKGIYIKIEQGKVTKVVM
jgi:hypothetical protein